MKIKNTLYNIYNSYIFLALMVFKIFAFKFKKFNDIKCVLFRITMNVMPILFPFTSTNNYLLCFYAFISHLLMHK